MGRCQALGLGPEKKASEESMNLDKLKEILANHEGEKLRLYKCTAGKLTIGIGHNIEDKGISKAVSDLLYREDIQEVLDDLPIIFHDFDNLPENIQLVLADMRFQLGARGIRGFRMMIKAVGALDWPGMIRQMKDSAWYSQTPNRANHLIRMVKGIS